MAAVIQFLQLNFECTSTASHKEQSIRLQNKAVAISAVVDLSKTPWNRCTFCTRTPRQWTSIQTINMQ